MRTPSNRLKRAIAMNSCRMGNAWNGQTRIAAGRLTPGPIGGGVSIAVAAVAGKGVWEEF
jgi:hypothetical protein